MEDIQYLPLATVYICTSSLPPSTQGAEISLLVERADFTNQKITSAGKNVEKVPSLGNNFKWFSCYQKGKLRDSAETSTKCRERNWWSLRDKTTSFYHSAIHSSQNAVATEIPATEPTSEVSVHTHPPGKGCSSGGRKEAEWRARKGQMFKFSRTMFLLRY